MTVNSENFSYLPQDNNAVYNPPNFLQPNEFDFSRGVRKVELPPTILRHSLTASKSNRSRSVTELAPKSVPPRGGSSVRSRISHSASAVEDLSKLRNIMPKSRPNRRFTDGGEVAMVEGRGGDARDGSFNPDNEYFRNPLFFTQVNTNGTDVNSTQRSLTPSRNGTRKAHQGFGGGAGHTPRSIGSTLTPKFRTGDRGVAPRDPDEVDLSERIAEIVMKKVMASPMLQNILANPDVSSRELRQIVREASAESVTKKALVVHNGSVNRFGRRSVEQQEQYHTYSGHPPRVAFVQTVASRMKMRKKYESPESKMPRPLQAKSVY